jgi:hypothetical protein
VQPNFSGLSFCIFVTVGHLSFDPQPSNLNLNEFIHENSPDG